MEGPQNDGFLGKPVTGPFKNGIFVGIYVRFLGCTLTIGPWGTSKKLDSFINMNNLGVNPFLGTRCFN